MWNSHAFTFKRKPWELYTCHVAPSETLRQQDLLLHCSSNKARLETKMRGRAIWGVFDSWTGVLWQTKELHLSCPTQLSVAWSQWDWAAGLLLRSASQAKHGSSDTLCHTSTPVSVFYYTERALFCSLPSFQWCIYAMTRIGKSVVTFLKYYKICDLYTLQYWLGIYWNHKYIHWHKSSLKRMVNTHYYTIYTFIKQVISKCFPMFQIIQEIESKNISDMALQITDSFSTFYVYWNFSICIYVYIFMYI